MTDEDRRLQHWCRMCLAAGAVVHWIAAGLLFWNDAHAAAYPALTTNLASILRLLPPNL